VNNNCNLHSLFRRRRSIGAAYQWPDALLEPDYDYSRTQICFVCAGSVWQSGSGSYQNLFGTTAATVAERLEGLRNKGASQFVLDLRGNPGGLLPGGVDTASLILEANAPVVFVVNKSGVVDDQQTLTTGFDLESPLVVLVDSNTASAAEVFTAALQENGRATLWQEKIPLGKVLFKRSGSYPITMAESPSQWPAMRHPSITTLTSKALQWMCRLQSLAPRTMQLHA
jgi:hypothetical protein